MNKISCDICIDLFPLVKDDVATKDSKMAVLEHIENCGHCKALYNNYEISPIDEQSIAKKIKKKVLAISIVLLVIGILFGISISANHLMFYNIIIMPIIGGVGYITFKNKSYYVLIAVFVAVYLRWGIETFGNVLHGDFAGAFIAPLWWSLIYVGLTALGIIIAFLFSFGFRKEKTHEKNS